MPFTKLNCPFVFFFKFKVTLFFKLFYCGSITVVPIFSPLLSTAPATPTPTVNPHPVFHVHGLFIHVPWLIPSPSFHHYASPRSPLVTVSLFHVSMTDSILLVCLFCSLHSSCSEIIWYLSFTAWLISLSIIFCRSIHAVAKGRSSFFLLCGIPLCIYISITVDIQYYIHFRYTT